MNKRLYWQIRIIRYRYIRKSELPSRRFYETSGIMGLESVTVICFWDTITTAKWGFYSIKWFLAFLARSLTVQNAYKISGDLYLMINIRTWKFSSSLRCVRKKTQRSGNECIASARDCRSADAFVIIMSLFTSIQVTKSWSYQLSFARFTSLCTIKCFFPSSYLHQILFRLFIHLIE